MRRLAPALALLLGGCSLPSLADVPLPGGAPSGPSYRITVEFADVLDLVPQAAVKVDDVTVGSVEDISLSGWTARVRLRVDKKVELPANATAAVRQTSLLGEKFVAVSPPTTEAARGRLSDGDTIPLARTRRGAEVEEVLAALGLLLNGGGLAQLKTINQELGTALLGREAEAKDALHQLDTFVGGLDRQKADIVRAIEALDRLTGRLAQQRAVIGGALDALAPGITVLAQQREQLTAALTALGELGRVGTRVVNQSKDDTVASLRALQPILDQLVRAGDDLPKSLDFMLSYPFPPNVTGAIVGDFVNLSITADLDAASILANLVAAAPSATSRSTPGRAATKPKQGGTTLPSLPGQLPDVCLPLNGILPPEWTPPDGCDLPEGCKLLAAGSSLPLGALVVPDTGILPQGTVFPAGTKLPAGTILTAPCLLAPVTGAVEGIVGGLTDVLTGGLSP
ncbi:MCE family protein [Phytohabitans rumicis]|uniref:ABC transporter substrate-binding protein n=1 Tax=Phytohabitans rumicis TaxID=1076125 RepID=A0A6V8L943_9ACTN|nr:MCE family protein [Phytohabitans rumicis]GFJ92120.1 ABC transporter substrate-binding protein [Phytohabitans rumicis]